MTPRLCEFTFFCSYALVDLVPKLQLGNERLGSSSFLFDSPSRSLAVCVPKLELGNENVVSYPSGLSLYFGERLSCQCAVNLWLPA